MTDISENGIAYADWLLEAAPGDILFFAIAGVGVRVRVVRVASEGRVAAEIVDVDDRARFEALLEDIALHEEITKPSHAIA